MGNVPAPLVAGGWQILFRPRLLVPRGDRTCVKVFDPGVDRSACLGRRCPDKPNIVLILTDDQGWYELGCHTNTFIQTAVLDRLSNQGVERPASTPRPCARRLVRAS